MRSIPDRFWWITVIGGSILIIENVILLVLAMAFFVVPSLLGITGWLSLLLPCAVEALLSIFLIMGFQARRRFRCRVRAFQGDQEAMPCAEESTDAAALDVSGDLLKIRSRTVNRSRDRIALVGAVPVIVLLFLPWMYASLPAYLLALTGNIDAPLPAWFHVFRRGYLT